MNKYTYDFKVAMGGLALVWSMVAIIGYYLG